MKRTRYLAVGTLAASLLGPAAVVEAQYYPVKLKPSLTLSVKPKRDSNSPFFFRGTGVLKRPSGVSKSAGCKGTVTIRIKQNARTVGRKTTKVRSNCKYSRRVQAKSLRGRKGSLRIIATFNGNSVLSKVNSKSKFVKYVK